MPCLKSRLKLVAFLFIFCSSVSLSGSNLEAPHENKALEALQSFAAELINNSRQIQASSNDLEAAELESRRRRLSFNPTVDISEFSSKATDRSYNPNTGLEVDYSTDRKGTIINLRQPTPIGVARISMEKSESVFTGNATMYFESLNFILETGLLRRDSKLMALENQMAHSYYSIEKARAESVSLDVLMQGFGALFDRLIAHRNMAFKERNLAFYQTMVDEAQVKLDNGLGSELDLKQAKMRLTLAQTTLHESRLVFEEADRRVGVIIGRSNWNRENAEFEPSELKIPDDVTFEDSLAIALSNRPDVRILGAQLKLQQQNRAMAAEKSKPNLVASVRQGRQGRSVDSSLAASKPDKSWNLMLTWSTTIGHRPERLTSRIEDQRLQALEKRFDDTLEKTRGDLEDAVERLIFHRSNLLALKESAKLSQEVLEGQQTNFQLGTVSLLDLSRYQSEYEESELAVIRAEVALVLSWIRLMHVTGELFHHFLPVELAKK